MLIKVDVRYDDCDPDQPGADVTSRTQYFDDANFPQAVGESMANTMLAVLDFRGWIGECLEVLVVQLRDHLEAEGSHVGLREALDECISKLEPFVSNRASDVSSER